MLRVNSITLYQFKNYPGKSFRFTERMIGICGSNGVGKTNLLDAIYYLCFTKSYFTRTDSNNVLHGAMGFRVEGNIQLDNDPHKLVCILRETGKKEFSVNEELYIKLADHVGRYPAVIITPDDVQIITDGSEERRRFLDALLSQLDPAYLQNLIDYNRILQQRNSYLKLIAENRGTDMQLLDVYDVQLAEFGNYIYNKRKEQLEQLVPMILKTYSDIAGANEDLDIRYESQLHNSSFPSLLRQYRERDKLSQRSNVGIHKDDLAFRLKDQPFKSIASQGQRKSLLFALKLSEFDLLKESKGFAPILLLDDVFEKLDADRMHNLLFRVCMESDGQVFITDTHAERIQQHFNNLDVSYQLLEI
jgi:DNA replication and repair protein RecF